METAVARESSKELSSPSLPQIEHQNNCRAESHCLALKKSQTMVDPNHKEDQADNLSGIPVKEVFVLLPSMEGNNTNSDGLSSWNTHLGKNLVASPGETDSNCSDPRHQETVDLHYQPTRKDNRIVSYTEHSGPKRRFSFGSKGLNSYSSREVRAPRRNSLSSIFGSKGISTSKKRRQSNASTTTTYNLNKGWHAGL
jgi:hypothetical protein